MRLMWLLPWSTIDTKHQADSLRQVLTSTINYILSMQGVILNADEPMSEKIKVAHCLHELVNYDDAVLSCGTLRWKSRQRSVLVN